MTTKKLSSHQSKVLAILANTKAMRFPVEFFYAPLFGAAHPRRPMFGPQPPPLEGAHRASLSRTLRRLERRGLITRSGRGLFDLTIAGRAVGEALPFDPGWLRAGKTVVEWASAQRTRRCRSASVGTAWATTER